MYRGKDIEAEAQLWERYTGESCFPIEAIVQCYGHIEAFNKLAGLLFDARQRAATKVCNILAEIVKGE
jgi:hypothetical protein